MIRPSWRHVTRPSWRQVGSGVWWALRDPLRPVLLLLLVVYRTFVSPLYGQVCRYYPSCSAYAVTAVRMRGSVVGTWLIIRRLARCHPWADGGVDHVPARRERHHHLHHKGV